MSTPSDSSAGPALGPAKLLTVDFGGYFICRLATDPDPTNETRGMSGYTMALATEDPFDHVIRLQVDDASAEEPPPARPRDGPRDRRPGDRRGLRRPAGGRASPGRRTASTSSGATSPPTGRPSRAGTISPAPTTISPS